MRFPTLDDAAARLVEAISAGPLPAPRLVVAAGAESRALAERVAAALGDPLSVSAVEHLQLPWYPRITLGALTADNHHYVDPVVAADHSIGAREVAQLCRERLPAIRGHGWRKPAPPGEAGVVVVVRALSTGYRALAVCASLRAAGAKQVMVVSPCGASDAIARVESAAPLIVLAPTDSARFDPGEFLPPAST